MGSLQNYYRYEQDNDDIRISKPFKYKISIKGTTPNNHNTITDAEIAVTLKYLSNFWRSLSITLINCKVYLTLTWFKNCVLPHSTVVLATQENS